MKFGWCEKDITPKGKIWEDGQFYERVSTGVETPITCTALAVENGDVHFVICSADLVGIYDNLLDGVREKIVSSSAAGLDPVNVILNATHSHTNYGYTRKNHIKAGTSLDIIREYVPADRKWVSLLPDDTDGVISRDEGLAYITDIIASCIVEAWNSRSEGGYLPGFGRPSVGMNRRTCYKDGSAKMWGDVQTEDFFESEAGTDNGMELLFIYDSSEKMTGVVANIACPAQIMEQRSVISSDYWGKVKILLREQFGDDFKVLALCSAAGDLAPRDLIRWVEPETPIKDPNVIRNNPLKRDADPSMFDVKGTWVAARRIVSEIKFAVEDNADRKPIWDSAIRHKCVNLMLPLRKVSEEEKDEAIRAIKHFVDSRSPEEEFDYDDSAAMYLYAGSVARWNVQQNLTEIPCEIHFMRIGNVAFATNPFELFVNYGNIIRARSKARQTVLIQLSNGCYDYLPTEKAEKGGHYSANVSSGYCGHEAGYILVEETLKEIEGLFEV